ncbi:PhzF family phenazine biosynthesis protein [Ramlibacter alkalitolerans]|uniref:PhzF family phenazine biosynthesis protein n=1 Tax=Ramlibacter alkalitolerans TaxID=2039631 RepID=A0ABS1JVR9_9BURK|nr:PhzF family phenazine biosynthesis protein [Ramlibacter alkalitolerans]MBL0428379.1 PhzF family phenazine biosynthesis protein [Ramlibacter alkalitolerans]
MTLRPFKQVDVFTAVPYRGNPLAVVLDGEGLSPEQMQHFCNWTNLSEATFLLPPTQPGADYRVRIFSPGRELLFAGHPTLGSCHAWLEAGGRPRGEHIVQECGVGLVKLRRSGERLAFAAPPLRKSGPLPEEDVALIARGLGVARGDIVDHAWCDNGPNWRGVLLQSAEQVLALQPDGAILAGLDVGVVGTRGKVGVVGTRGTGDECLFEVRAFFPGNNGMTEDPVTGSLNAALAQWLIGAGIAPPRYVASQGTALGRAGRVHVERDAAGETWIGGATVTCVDGQVRL